MSTLHVRLHCVGMTLLISLLFSLSSKVYGHPVSYKGSKGIMGYHAPMLSHNQINYSLLHWIAFGVHHIRRPDVKGRHASFATTNILLKRWNGKHLQANIYGVVGLGQSQLGLKNESSGLGLLQFDIENRDYYFLAKQLQVLSRSQTDLHQTVLRFGLSPYIESYSGIHSWLILEWQQSEFADGRGITDLTPFLRVFYKNLLFEIGQSFDGMTKFNYITHF